MRQRKSFLALIILAMIVLFPMSGIAASIRVSWNPNTDLDLAGYKLYYGTGARNYTSSVNVGNVTTYQITNLDTGRTYYVAVKAYDNAGNESVYSDEVSAYIPVPDTTPPTGSVVINAGAATTSSRSVTLTLNATDSGGVAGMKLSNDGQTWTAECSYATPQAWVLSSGDGTRTVSVLFKDTSGNWMTTPASDTIVLAQDSDGDGMLDAWEIAHGLDPNNANDAGLDADNDGITNIEEYYNGTDPQYRYDNAPVVEAGANQQSDPTRISLDGSSSSDPNGDVITSIWSQVSGPQVSLENAQTKRASFLGIAAGQYTFRLSCSDGKTTSSDTTTVTINNVAPTVNAGNDVTIDAGQTVTLHAAGQDANNNSLGYSWTLVDGPSITLPVMNTQNISITPQNPGLYKFAVRCSDGVNQSPSDEVYVTANAINHAPTAEAGVDKDVQFGTRVNLDGRSSSDPDGNPLSYSWAQVSGPQATLYNAQSAQPYFDATLTGTLMFELIVNDGKVNSTPDTVTIRVLKANNAPIADAGTNMKVKVGTMVTLDASASTDPDGDILTYRWEQVSGATVELTGFNTMNPSFTPTVTGVLEFKVVVSDGQASAEDSVQITVDSINHVPVAEAGNGIIATIGQKVTLDGCGSYDADGDSLSFIWSQVDGPRVSLSAPNSVNPSFVSTEIGTYIFELKVYDGKDTSIADTVTISVQEGTVNIMPVSPTNGAVVTKTPIFSWSADNMTSFTLYIALNNSSYTRIYSGMTKSYSMHPSLWQWFVSPRTTIRWYVIGEGGGKQVKSAEFSFKRK